jgi:hypothetical protein
MDAYAEKYNPFLYLERHRQYRHHDEGVKRAEKLFGYYAGLAAKLHIIRDNSWYVYFDINKMREDDIEGLYQKALVFCHDPVEEPNEL